MQTKTFTLNWSALTRPDAPAIRLLRLCRGAAGTLLFSAVTRAQRAPGGETVLSAALVSGTQTLPAPFVIPQLLPSPPQWDVERDGGAFHVVIEQAGGAINALALLKWRQSAATVSARYPFDSFHAPRFVKHGTGAGKQAIAMVVNARHLGVFAVKGGGYDAYTPVCDARAGIVLQEANGDSLFYKEETAGAARGSDIAPGRLHYQRLGVDFKPVSAAIKPLGNATIFEFDVDAAGQEAALCATTEKGFILAAGAAANAAFAWSAYTEASHAAVLTRPCLLMQDRVLRLAALEAEQTPHARVLVSAAALP